MAVDISEVTESVILNASPKASRILVTDIVGRLKVVLHRQKAGVDSPVLWSSLAKEILTPDVPFEIHQLLFQATYCDWKESERGPPPAWIPDPESAKSTNLGRLMESHGSNILGNDYSDPIRSFHRFHEFSIQKPELYWPLIFRALHVEFQSFPEKILEASESTLQEFPGGLWLPSAALNAAECCLFPTADGFRSDDRTAVVWRNEGDAQMHSWTLCEVRFLSCQVSNTLQGLGFRKGDRVAIDMGMTPESVVIYLGVILSGCVVVSIPDSFAAPEIATRLSISNPKLVFTQDVLSRGGKSIPLYPRLAEAGAPQTVVVPSNGLTPAVHLRDGDMSWGCFLGISSHLKRPGVFRPVAMHASDHSNILFSSGTTGTPKAIPWTHLTPLKAASDAHAHNDIQPGDVFAWPTNIGWMMGPYLIYGALINGATIALFNGSPNGAEFGVFVQDAKVNILGVVPSLVKSWRASSCLDGVDWSNIRSFSSTGEASSPDDVLWLMSRASYAPVIELCGGTEIGGGFISGTLVQSQCLSTFSTPVMGCQLSILDARSKPTGHEELVSGECALSPFIFGSSTGLLNADHSKVYFEGMPRYRNTRWRRHGDEFERLRGGYFRAHGRVDDAMNLGGIKVSSVEVERVCNNAHAKIQEVAAIAVSPAGGGPSQLLIVVVPRDGAMLEIGWLRALLTKEVQTKINPLFKVSHVTVIDKLPRTASNKVMRRLLRNEFDKKHVKLSKL